MTPSYTGGSLPGNGIRRRNSVKYCAETPPILVRCSSAVKITIASPCEADALTDIAIAGKRHWQYPEDLIEKWRPLLTVTPASIAANQTYVARAGEQIIGFAHLATERDGLWLEHLWVSPANIGCGIGRALFRHAQQQGRPFGFATFHIESDPNAAAFYERMGAKKVRVR